ncbi:MAG TPA: hypothetical protein VHL80_09520 [Polyangia bacterium]|nr:hypothetical protein [Polyangia bacterium]
MNDRRSRPARLASALALAATLLGLPSARARGDEVGVVVAPAAAPPAPAPPRPDAVPLDENTARLIGRHRLKLGVLAFDYAPTEWLSFGSDPPEWAIRSVTSVLVPNAHVKGQLLRTPSVEVSGRVAGYYANINNTEAHGHVLILPFTLYLSTRVARPLWLHFEGAYNWARGSGAGDVAKTDVWGTVVMRTAQLGIMAELRLSRVVALFARGRYQAYETPVIFQGGGMIDPFTRAQASLEAKPAASHPAMGVAGVALTWRHVGLVAGAGYGHYFVPGANLALPYNNVVPEGSLWVLF